MATLKELQQEIQRKVSLISKLKKEGVVALSAIEAAEKQLVKLQEELKNVKEERDKLKTENEMMRKLLNP